MKILFLAQSLVPKKKFKFLGKFIIPQDSNNAWLKIIEADGDDALIRNKDSGSVGDVFTDGTKFGNIEQSDGMMIYDNRGRLVSWFASVESSDSGNYLISITPVIEINSSNVLTPRQPVELLNGESIFVEVYEDKTMVLFGDGKKMMNELNSAIKDL